MAGKIEIYSLLGQIVLHQDLQVIINLESLAQGVYYLRIRDRKGQVIKTRKIVKR